MAITDPKTIDEITPRWMTEILRQAAVISDNSVATIDTQEISGGKAWLSSIVRVGVEYSSMDERLPLSFVVKMLAESRENRDAEYENSAYKREIHFYEDIALSLPIRLPELYYSNNKNLMLIEDLSYLAPGDQIQGMSTEQVLTTLESLAKVHSVYWDSPRLNSLKWLPDTNNIEVNYIENWDSFVELCGSFIDDEALRIGEKLAYKIPWLLDEISKGPRTIVNDDMKADNLLFGEPGTDEAVVILDWQFAIKSMGAVDVARLIGGSWDPVERNSHQVEAFRSWYDKLIEYGVRGYGWKEAQIDFKLASLYCLCFPVHFHKGITRAQGRALEYIKRLYRGLFLLALEIDAESVLS